MTIDELNSFMEEHGFFNCRNTEPINAEYVADLVQFALIDGYNKAIDDYMIGLCRHCMQQKNECNKKECPFSTGNCGIVSIAEKLKEGD